PADLQTHDQERAGDEQKPFGSYRHMFSMVTAEGGHTSPEFGGMMIGTPSVVSSHRMRRTTPKDIRADRLDCFFRRKNE
ncbi:MAG: hypothetical protein ACRD2A_16600, partial [Vicinamibacterales bacterium]